LNPLFHGLSLLPENIKIHYITRGKGLQNKKTRERFCSRVSNTVKRKKGLLGVFNEPLHILHHHAHGGIGCHVGFHDLAAVHHRGVVPTAEH
jgi:hypothetical protein